VWLREGYIETTLATSLTTIIFSTRWNGCGRFILQCGFRQMGAARVVQVLEKKGLKMVEFGQGLASMSSPAKELERLILSGKIRHGSNPLLTWMADQRGSAHGCGWQHQARQGEVEGEN